MRHSDGRFADLALATGVDLVSLFSLAVSHGVGSLYDGKQAWRKPELGGDTKVKLKIRSR